MIKQIVLPMVIVGLPTAEDVRLTSISKLDYTIPYTISQTQGIDFRSTLKFNYTTTEDWIKEYNKKFKEMLR